MYTYHDVLYIHNYLHLPEDVMKCEVCHQQYNIVVRDVIMCDQEHLLSCTACGHLFFALLLLLTLVSCCCPCLIISHIHTNESCDLYTLPIYASLCVAVVIIMLYIIYIYVCTSGLHGLHLDRFGANPLQDGHVRESSTANIILW